MNIKNIGMNTFTSRSKRQATCNSVAQVFGFSWLKQAFVLLAMLMVSSGVWGQANGDYQTRADGNWTANTTWQVRSGGAWVNCSVGDYPGATSGAGTVTIVNSDEVILNISPANAIGALVLQTGNRASSITYGSNYSLVVAGNTTIEIPTSTNPARYKFIKVLSGSFTTSNIIINASGDDGRDSYIEISSGSLFVSGNITMSGSVLKNYILFSGNGTLNVGGGFVTNGFITSTADGGGAPTLGTVNYYNAAQTVWPTTYNNLTLSGSGAKTFPAGTTTVNGILSREGTATSTVTGTLTYGASSTLQYKGSALQTTGSEFPTTFIGTGGVIIDNMSGVNMSGDHAIDNALTFTNGSFSIGANTLTLNGTIPTCGSLIGGATSNLIIGGASANTNIPSVTLNNLTLNRANGATLCGAVTVNNLLTLTSGNLSLGAYNLTLGTSATISGSPYSGTKMIETNGTGNLVKQSTTTAGFNITYPVGVGSLYNPMILSSLTGSVLGTGSVSVRAVSGLAPNTSSTDLKKHWIVSSTNLTLTSTNISFAYINPTDVGGTQGEYTLRYSTTPAVVWSAPNTPSASGVNPMTTTSSTVLDGTWTAREVNQTWYSMRSGNWNDPTIWTLDPAGSLFNNPLNTYPQLVSDNVVVKNGKNVVVNVSNLTCKDLTVQGSLDFASTTGHTFATINGNGRILLSSNNWPAGNATDFITPGQGEGTTVFYGNSFSLTSARTFFNMEVMMNAGQTLTLMSDFTLNNNLEIKTGTFKINDDAATSIRSLIAKANVTVSLGASITTGLGKTNGLFSIPGTMPASGNYHSIYHRFEIWGDFTNNGTVRFTNQATNAPVYNQFTSTGAVSVWFKGLTNNIATCNGTTDFYNLIIDKGTDQTYTLELNASSATNFALYGPNSVGRNENAPYSALNPEIRKALWIYNGTLKLTGDLTIPTLSEGNDVSGNGDYAIGGNACMWIASANVSVYSTANLAAQLPASAVGLNAGSSNQALSVYGKFRISAGTFATRNSAGLIFWSTANAIVSIEGGTTTVAQFRSAASGSGQTSYLQSGGILKVDGIGEVTNGFPIFGFDSSDGVFVMSGGEIQVLAESGNANDIYIPIVDGNYNVTGGKLTASVNGNITLDFNSNVPFYNVDISRLNASNTAVVSLKTGLKVLGSLSLGNNSTLTSNNFNVSIGKDFTTGATASTYTAGTNTTTFNGAQNSILTNAAALSLNKLVINKSTHPTLGSFYEVALAGAGQLSVASDLTITLGSLNTGSTSPNVAGNIAITSGSIISTVAGIPSTGKIVLNSTTATQTLSGSGLNFGSITLNNTNFGAQLLSDVVVKDLVFNAAGTAKVNMGVYNLTATGAITNADGVNRWIYGAGNASDGGLSLYVNANGAKTFPIGIATEFTPCVMTVSGYSDDGYVTCTPVNELLQTTLSTGGVIMPYYWRMNHSGFTTRPSVSYVFTYAKTNDVTYIAGKVLDESPYTRSPQAGGSVNDVVEASKTILFSTPFVLEKANYTAGAQSRFTGGVKVYYTKYNASDAYVVSWNDGNSWTLAPTDLNSNGQVDSYEKHDSRQPVAGAFPGIGDIAVIGWSPWTDPVVAQRGLPHGLSIDNYTQSCAEVIFSQMTDATGNPVPRIYRYPFQFRPTLCINNTLGNLNASMVRGEGMFWNRYSDPDFSLMDIGEFAAQDSSYILYESVGPTIAKTPTLAPNLTIGTSGWGGDDLNVTLTKNIVTTGNFELLGDVNIVLSNGATGDISVGRDLVMFEQGGFGGGARLDFPNSTTNRTVTVGRDLLMNNNGALISVASPNTTIQDHNLIVGRDIVQKTTTNGLVLWTANNQDRITLTLNGSNSMTYTLTSGATPELYRLIVNKGTSIATTAQFNNDFNLNGTTSGAGVPKALVLTNGLFIVNNAATTLALTTGNDNFPIPASAGLEVRLGIVNATGTSGIELDGLLRISGATLNMAGADNPIIYGAGGSSIIDVSAGSLIVGGQIRRATNSDVGTLKYYQSGGNVYVGRTTTGATTRGTFEVLGTGSVLSITGGDLYIERAASVSVPALYLMPETTTLASANTMHIGSASVGSQTIGIYSTPSLQNLDVLNSSTAKLMTVPLNLSGNLSISSGTFNANALALNIGGNFVNNATFTHGNNTTTFNGSIAQAISGTTATTFYKLTKTTSNTLTTQTAITVANDLTLSSGVIADNGNTITVKGDVTVNGTHQYGGAGKGILLDNGTVSQNLLGNGTIGMLTINNSKGVDVAIGNLLTISNNLRLESGVFNIDKNLLTLGVNAQIIAGNAFSSSNMIQTNVSFTDNGVKKIFPSGASGLFTYPVGSGGKYAPVMFTVTGNGNSTGSITIKPAAEYHPSVLDPTNVLNYYWTVVSSGISGFSATANLNYDQTDVRLTGANTEADYIAARLLSDGLGQWNKFDVTTVNEPTNQIQFSYSAVGDAEISGDYTAGINSAIPNKVPRFESTKNGDWTDVSVWSLIDPVTSIPGAAGVGIPVGGPRGSIATVKHVVTSTGNGLSSYNTIISGTTANLITGSTYNHRLGIVSGTGTLTCSVGDLPAADYSLFFASTGGTLEYNGASNIDILTDLPTINNLKLSGTGTRILPNIDIQLLGNLTIVGPIVNNDTYDKAISIKGNITFDSGTFSAGNLASAKLIMNGSSVQTVSGLSSFTSATNDLNHFEINNSVGVVLSKPVDVLGNLTLTNGYLTTTTTNILKMTTASSTASAGSSTAFVDGPMMKQMTAGGNFNFPIGKSGRLGTIDITSVSQSGLWYAEYFNNSPNNQSLTTSNVTAPVAIVSQGEYWNILAPAAATAGVKLYWDASSGVDPSSSDMRGVQWITNSWNEVALGTKTGTSAGGSAPTSSVVSFNANAGGNYITFGSITIPAYTWTGSVNTDWFTAGNWTGGVPTGSSNTTIASTINKPVISGSTVAQTNNLTLQTGATLTINAGGKMTVNGNLSIADANSLIVKNTPASMASLITNGTISGTTRVETTMPLGNRYWYYGFSVNGAGVTSGVWNATDIVNTWAYKANTTAYVRFTDNLTPLGSNPHSGLLNGYSVKLLGTGNTTLVVQGSLNNGNLSTTLPNNSWNLMCNPYPSSLDMSIVYANNVADYGTDKVDPMMWVPTNESGSTVQRTYNFATSIGTNGGTKILPPTQGFWLRNTNTGPQNFTVNQAARLHSATALKSLSTPIEEDLFRFELVGATMSDEMVVGFRDIGSVGVTMYDSEKRLNSGTSSCNIYSVKATKGLAVNLLPLMGVDTVVVPLSVNAGTAAAGNYSVRATNLATFDSSIDVYFVDVLNDITIDLRQVNVVSLNLSAGTVNNRYVLKFAPSSTGVATTLPEFKAGADDNEVVISQQENDVLVTIPGEIEPKATIELYGIEGQLIRVKKQLEKVTRIHLPNDNNIYVVRVTNNGKVKSAKVVSMGR